MKDMRDSYVDLLSEVEGMRQTFRDIALEHYERRTRKRENLKGRKIKHLVVQFIIAIVFSSVFALGFYRRATLNSTAVPLNPVSLPEKLAPESRNYKKTAGFIRNVWESFSRDKKKNIKWSRQLSSNSIYRSLDTLKNAVKTGPLKVRTVFAYPEKEKADVFCGCMDDGRSLSFTVETPENGECRLLNITLK
jgi:hypothetical protein